MNDIKEKSPQKSGEKETSFASFLWNPRSKEFCGRTPSSWGKLFSSSFVSVLSTIVFTQLLHFAFLGKIILFYLIFYLCLAAFWAIMLLIFKTTIDDKEPKWKLEDSRIGAIPGRLFSSRLCFYRWTVLTHFSLTLSIPRLLPIVP